MLTIYLIGAPGVGKTVLTEAFTKDWKIIGHLEDPVKYRLHETPHGRAISLGWLRPNFGGTDTLGNTAIVPIEEWYPKVAQSDFWAIYGEGDRLANARFFNLAQSVGDFILFYLDTDPVEAEARRQKRSLLTGKLQNPSWVKGRQTKHQNLAHQFGAYRLDGSLSPEQNAKLMWDVVLS